jgi:hypothetical protein
LDLSAFRAAFPLYPTSARAVLSTAHQLVADPHWWADVAIVHAESLGCYLLRGISPRLAKQQEAQYNRQQQQQQAAEADAAAVTAASTGATDSSAAAAPALTVPAAGDSAIAGLPNLLQAADVPDWQFVLPSDVERIWSHDTSVSLRRCRGACNALPRWRILLTQRPCVLVGLRNCSISCPLRRC